MTPNRRSIFTRLFAALLALLAHTGLAHAQNDNCVTGLFVPPDANFIGPGGSRGVLPQLSGGHITALQLDQNGDGDTGDPGDAIFTLPFEAQDALEYFLSPSQDYVLARACPNISSCPATGGPGASAPITIALLRVPTSGAALALIHTDCLGGGLLNANGRWYEAGLCHPIAPGLPCNADANYALGATDCNYLFIARTDNNSDNVLRFYNLIDPTPSTIDGRQSLQLNGGIEDTTLALDRGGNVLLAKSRVDGLDNQYDVNIIDICPGSSTFGQRLTGGISPYTNVSNNSGLLTATASGCTAASFQVTIRVANFVLGPVLGFNRCCTGTGTQMGRCCNPMNGACVVNTLAACITLGGNWSSGGNCQTACPPPAPALDLTASGPSNTIAGAPVTYTYVCTNVGFANAANTSVRATIPSSFVDIISITAGGVSSNGQITWSLGTLTPGAQSAPLTVTYRPKCLATAQAFSVNATATATSTPIVQSQPPISVVTALGPTSPITATLTSVPAVGQPLPPGTIITHTLTLVNPLNVTRWRTGFSANVGAGVLSEAGLNAGGGTFIGPFPNFTVTWLGDLAPNSATNIVFTSKVFDCLPPNALTNQLGFGQSLFVADICGNALAILNPGPVFTLQPPVSAALSVTAVPGVSSPAGGLPNAPTAAIVRRGQVATFQITLRNLSTTALTNGFASIAFSPEFLINNPPFVNPVPGLTFDAGSSTLSYLGPVPASGTVTIEFQAMLDPAVRCAAVLALRAGYGACSFPAASLRVFNASEPPSVPHLVGQDYIDGLWTFRPGVDTTLQPLLCFNFGGSGSGGISRAPNGDIFMSQPFIRFNPNTLAFDQLPFPPGPSFTDVAFNPAGGKLLLVRGRQVDSYDLTAHTAQTIHTDPTRFFGSIVVGGDGRIAVLSAGELRIIDARPPAALPVPVASVVAVAMPSVVFANGAIGSPAGVQALTTDGNGDYVVTVAMNVPGDSQAIALIKVDRLTLATSVVNPAISGPAPVMPLTTGSLPRTCSAVGDRGEFYLGTFLTGALFRIDSSANPPVENLLSNGFPGCLDMAHTQPGIVGGVPICRPDFNLDGTLDPDDLADFISAFFIQPAPITADFNGDGIVDPDDLADYIGAFFAGCP